VLYFTLTIFWKTDLE